jgi:hypothetical protein
LAEILFLAFAASLIIWWPVTPVRRGVLMLPGAAVGFVLWSVGNVVGEIIGIEFGAYFFFVGAFIAYVLVALAGIVTLKVPLR